MRGVIYIKYTALETNFGLGSDYGKHINGNDLAIPVPGHDGTPT